MLAVPSHQRQPRWWAGGSGYTRANIVKHILRFFPVLSVIPLLLLYIPFRVFLFSLHTILPVLRPMYAHRLAVLRCCGADVGLAAGATIKHAQPAAVGGHGQPQQGGGYGGVNSQSAAVNFQQQQLLQQQQAAARQQQLLQQQQQQQQQRQYVLQQQQAAAAYNQQLIQQRAQMYGSEQPAHSIHINIIYLIVFSRCYLYTFCSSAPLRSVYVTLSHG